MNKIYIDFVEILKSFIQGTKPDITGENTDWDAILKLAEIHSVTGIVGYMAMKYSLPTSPQVMAFMRQRCLFTISMYTRRAEQMKVQIQKMNKAGIDHLLFKGFLVRQLYRIPELRTFGDIDFVIRKKDREKSNELMLSQGFELKSDWEPVFTFVKGTEIYEIHTDVMEVDVSDKANYREYFSHIWENAVNVKAHTYYFTPEFHFIYLLTHIAKHISGSGAGIRMYMDIAVYIQHYGNTMNWKWIIGEFEKLKFTDYVNVVLTAVEKWFGIKSPIKLKPLDAQLINDFLEFTLKGGTFGHFNRNSGVIALKQRDRNNSTISRIGTLVHRLFPSASSIENRYTYLQHKHWLVPIAWIHRLFRTKTSLKEHKAEMKNIINADTEEVLKLKKIYKEIGL